MENTTKTPAVKAAAEQLENVQINTETLRIINAAFDCQDDVENETRFLRKFLYDAVYARAKYEAQQAVNKWENEITRLTKIHKDWTRTVAAEKLLESKKAKALKDLADKGAALLASL